MTHVVTDACIRCKYMDCVEACPADCFYEGENMLVINASECIDCSICIPECPADAILPDIDKDAARWVELNATYAALWPNIARRKDAPADADAHRGEADKFDKYFSAKPAAAS
ncbi:MAG: ferredoxin FdxA [Sphingobium sp.]|jgi:ferredoxin